MTALRVGLCALIAFAVLAFGAADVWAASALEIGSAILFLYWALIEFRNPQATIRWVPLAWPVAGFVVIGILQLVLHGTANPFLTSVQLLRAISAVLVFFLAAQAFRTRTELSQLAWFLILLSFFVSLFGIVQHFTPNGKIYWIQSLAVPGEFFGPYVNRNHFAGFVELTMPVGLALIAFRGVRRDLVPLATLLAIVPIGAVVLCGSRAGVISVVFQIALLLFLARIHRVSQRGQVVAVGCGDHRCAGVDFLAGHRNYPGAVLRDALGRCFPGPPRLHGSRGAAHFLRSSHQGLRLGSSGGRLSALRNGLRRSPCRSRA